MSRQLPTGLRNSRGASFAFFFIYIYIFLKETTGIKAPFRIFSETLPRGEVCSGSCLQRKACKGHSGSGKELPALETCQDFGEQSMKACFQSALSNPPLTLHTLPLFFLAHAHSCHCSFSPPSFQPFAFIFRFAGRPFVRPGYQLISSKTRLPTFPIRPDHPTNLSREMRDYHFPPPQPYAESYIRCL